MALIFDLECNPSPFGFNLSRLKCNPSPFEWPLSGMEWLPSRLSSPLPCRVTFPGCMFPQSDAGFPASKGGGLPQAPLPTQDLKGELTFRDSQNAGWKARTTLQLNLFSETLKSRSGNDHLFCAVTVIQACEAKTIMNQFFSKPYEPGILLHRPHRQLRQSTLFPSMKCTCNQN